MLAYFRCVDAKSAYDSIQWPSLILIIGMMPFSTALQKNGGVEFAVKWLTQIIDGWGNVSCIDCTLCILCISWVVYFQYGYCNFDGTNRNFSRYTA